jgi:glycosyltransferase involved in cell wall biosynthesis
LHVLFLTKYPPRGASSRYRVYQYIPYLEDAGFACTVQSLHTGAYLESRYRGRGRSPAYYAARMLGRLRSIAAVDRRTIVFIQKELLPFAPPIPEYLLHRSGARLVCDVDDAIHLRYAESRNTLVRLALSRKVASVFRLSAAVLAGNEFLRDYAVRFNEETVLFPTVIDTSRYPLRRTGLAGTASGGPPVVGWIGSPATVPYLAERGAALSRLASTVPFTLRVIGAPGFTIAGVEVEAVPWSEEREAAEIGRCDIGIMPLPDSSWARGKCGLKCLQYMACGLPVVSSPWGSARSIVAHGVHGFLARTEDEWIAHLATLLRNADLRRQFGRAGRRRVEEAFSIGRWAPRMAEILGRVAAGESIGGDAP